ncbi:MAG: molecular chaperone Tir [Alphaproteobacteria bacterium HGW-Alphaproteobacteria-18]|nr:MAG: molecular chaperone Tir [Alphaproteobacteria bacterium HGW-Alphaproteobacteria-18]
MPYRNKTYVCFDGDNDMGYYRLMTAWSENEKQDFQFYNAHDLNVARDSSQEESIKKQLRERFANSKLLVVLVGNNTWRLTKFVKWEMEVALKLGLPIIAVNLNGSKNKTPLCPSAIKDELVMFVAFKQKIIQYAMDNWPAQHHALKREGKSGDYYYPDHVYKQLGLD